MESLLTKDSLVDWMKLVLISNFFNAQVLLSIVGYAWDSLIRLFYTTVEFDEFDATYCE